MEKAEPNPSQLATTTCSSDEVVCSAPLNAHVVPVPQLVSTSSHRANAASPTSVGRLAVVVPAHNEASSLPSVLARLQATVAIVARDYKVFVVADRCTDRTAEVARLAGAEVVEKSAPGGLGAVFQKGLQAALEWDPDVIACIDADGQYREADLLRLIALLQPGVDLAIGNRLHSRPPGMSVRRYLLNKAASKLVQRLARTHVPDSQSGIRAFSIRVAAMDLRRDYTYTQEQILRCSAEGLTLAFAQVAFGPRTAGRSRLMRNSLHYTARALPALALSAIESVRARRFKSRGRR